MMHDNAPDTQAGALSADQRRTVQIAWGTYAAFYLGRLNISLTLPLIAGSFDTGLGEVGILGTVFFWCYAVGQIINGQVGNFVRPHWMILSGILLIATTNILFAFQSSLWLMGLLWGINGFAQAAGWGPMLRILSSSLTVTQRQRLSTVFSMSFQVGTSVAWGLSGLLIALGGWRSAFWVPGLLLLGVAFVWRNAELDVAPGNTSAQVFGLHDVRQEVWQMIPLLVAAAATGFVYIGFLLWLPTFIETWGISSETLLLGLTVLVPLLGIPGMRFAGILLAKQSDLLRTIMSLLSGLLLCLILGYMISAILPQMVVVLIAVMIASGLAGLLLSAVPILLAKDGRVSSSGGLITAVWSLAGGMAGTVVGGVVDQAGWPMVFILWAGFTIVAMGAVRVASGRMPPQTQGA